MMPYGQAHSYQSRQRAILDQRCLFAIGRLLNISFFLQKLAPPGLVNQSLDNLEYLLSHIPDLNFQILVAEVMGAWFCHGSEWSFELKGSIFNNYSRLTQCNGDEDCKAFDTYLGNVKIMKRRSGQLITETMGILMILRSDG